MPVLANDAWEALLAAHATLMKRFAASDAWGSGTRGGVTMREYDVLYTLSKCPSPVNITELNRHVLLSQPALSRLVDRLTARGLVARHADPKDRRGVLLGLTGAGREVQGKVGRRHAWSVAEAVSAALTREEMGQLAAICNKLAGGAQ